MATTHDSHFVRYHFFYPPDQVNTSNDPLSVDVLVLYLIGGDGSGEKLSDFVFQDQRQSPENGKDEPARNAPALAPISLDLLERGQLPPSPESKAQPGTDKDVGSKKGTYLRSRRSGRRLPIDERKVNWLTDGDGQLFQKAIEPLNLTRIIGVGIDLKRISNVSFAQVSKDIGNELRKCCGSRPMVFLSHGFAAFFVKDILEANQELDLRPAIAAIGMFGIDPKHRDISELRLWTAEKRCKISPQSLILNNYCEDDFGKAMDSLLRAYFVSVFAFRTNPPDGGQPEESKPIFSVLNSDPIWSGGGLDQMATFSGLEDAGFRDMCKYIVESVEGHQLLTAAQKNDLQTITTLIRRGTNIDSINYTSRDHRTALAIAAEAGHIETVKFLSTKDYISLDHGIDGETSALHCAVKTIRNLIGDISQAEIDEADEYHDEPATRILDRLKNGELPLDDQIAFLDTSRLGYRVKQLVRTIKVVEVLLEAGAFPSIRLFNTLNTQNPLERIVKQLSANPPAAVQGPQKELVPSTPSEKALEVCRNTPCVVREVFSVGADKKDRYIPIYTDIHQVIYHKESSTRNLHAGTSTTSPSEVLSPVVAISGPIITFQADDTPGTAVEPQVIIPDTSRKFPFVTDQEFNIDIEFGRRKENSNEAASQLLCRWYHIPMNNMAWVHDLFAKLGVHVWPWPQGYRDYTSRSRVVYPQFVKPKPLVESPSKSNPIVHAIMIPYLSYEQSYRTLVTEILRPKSFGQSDEDEMFSMTPYKTREDRWMDRLMGFSGYNPRFSDTYKHDQGPMLEQLANASEVATFAPQAIALTDAYLTYKHDAGYKLPLHPRLTLDQSHYYMLRDTTYRDRTQVVSRWFRKNRRLKAQKSFNVRDDRTLFEEEDHNILMVDQLWIWLIKDYEGVPESDATREKVTLITSFPDRFGTKSAARDNIARQVFRDSTRDSFRVVTDLVRQIISVCLRTLNEDRVDGSISFLLCFEISLGDVEERSGLSFLEFRRLSELLEHLDEKHPDYLHRRGLLLKMLLRINEDSKVLSEAKDVLDEITMIQGVLQTQESVLGDHDAELVHLLGTWTDRLPLYNELRRMLGNFDQMKQRAQSVVDSMEKLLDMKQKHANLWEARTSREGSEHAAKAADTLWWFTVVTIIFLPLSFMASFFALDIDKFPKDDGGNTNWPLNSVVGLLFGTSMAVIIPIYTLAFFSENLQRTWASIPRTWSKIRGIWMPLMTLPILWALNKLFLSDMSYSSRSRRIKEAVREYEPGERRFVRVLERMSRENRSAVIKDDALDEEDDLIRELRRYYNKD